MEEREAHAAVDKGLAVEVSMRLQEMIKPALNRDPASAVAGLLHALSVTAKDMSGGDEVRAMRLLSEWHRSAARMLVRPVILNG